MRSASSAISAARDAAGFAQADDQRRRQRAGAQAPLLPAAGEQRRQAHPRPAAHEQRADALRPVELVAGERQQVDASAVTSSGILPAACAASVWNSAPAPAPAPPRAAMSCTTPVSLFTAITLTSSVGTASAARSTVGVEQPVGPHRQEHRLEALVGEVGHALQDAFVLGRDVTTRRRGSPCGGGEAGGALDGDVVALGRAGGEHDLARLGADQRGDLRRGPPRPPPRPRGPSRARRCAGCRNAR